MFVIVRAGRKKRQRNRARRAAYERRKKEYQRRMQREEYLRRHPEARNAAPGKTAGSAKPKVKKS